MIGVLLVAVTGVLLLGCRTEDVVATADTGGAAGASASGGTIEAGSPTASCANSVRDPGESDVDCGGPCPACAIGAACTSNENCASGSCADSKCAATLSVYYTAAERTDSVLMVRATFEIHND
ncbi:MAG TPA: hypothetical protein VF294_06740, partial [Polyangiaceae bacterium]